MVTFPRNVNIVRILKIVRNNGRSFPQYGMGTFVSKVFYIHKVIKTLVRLGCYLFSLIPIGYNADIICVQECDKRFFMNDLLFVLEEHGMTGSYQQKQGQRAEGVATFYRKDKFRYNYYCLPLE